MAILLIADPAVQTELRCRPDQRREIKALIEQVQSTVWVLRDWPLEKSRGRLRPLLAALEAAVARLLDHGQHRRLKEILLQQRGPAGLLWPDVAQSLSIVPGQQSQIRSIIDETQARVLTLRSSVSDEESARKARLEVIDLTLREQKRILELLTEQQKLGWAKLRGKRFDFSNVQPIPVPAPEFVDGGQADNWIHVEAPLRLSKLRGQVVVVHFWTFGCVNCVHNYEWYKAWQREFSRQGVTLVGIHTPETTGERDFAKLRRKLEENGLTFPVLIDNDRENWDAWGNSVWPSIYLVDCNGRVRYWWYGELNWAGQEGEKLMRRRIEELLRESPEGGRPQTRPALDP